MMSPAIRPKPGVSFFGTLAVSLALGCLSSGCGSGGPALHGVSGKVSLDGKPITQGSITFVPSAGTKGPSGGSSIENGKYQVPRDKGLVSGTYRVEIRSQRSTGKKTPAQSPSPPGTMMDEMKEAVPVEFNSASTLEVEIPAPKNQLDFDLTAH
jgi:hypothetical protein